MYNSDLDWRTWLHIIVFAVCLFVGLAVMEWLQLWVDHFQKAGYQTGSNLAYTAQMLAMFASLIGAGLVLRNMNRLKGKE